MKDNSASLKPIKKIPLTLMCQGDLVVEGHECLVVSYAAAVQQLRFGRSAYLALKLNENCTDGDRSNFAAASVSDVQFQACATQMTCHCRARDEHHFSDLVVFETLCNVSDYFRFAVGQHYVGRLFVTNIDDAVRPSITVPPSRTCSTK